MDRKHRHRVLVATWRYPTSHLDDKRALTGINKPWLPDYATKVRLNSRVYILQGLVRSLVYTGSSSDKVCQIFHRLNPSGRTTALGPTQPK